MSELATSPYQPLVERYVALWNETDPARRRSLAEAAFAPQAAYADPLAGAEGPQAVAAMVGAVQERFPGHRLRLTSGIDEVAGHLRFSWALAPDDGPVLAAGTDFCTVAGDRFTGITGFIDHMAAAASAAAE